MFCSSPKKRKKIYILRCPVLNRKHRCNSGLAKLFKRGVIISTFFLIVFLLGRTTLKLIEKQERYFSKKGRCEARDSSSVCPRGELDYEIIRKRKSTLIIQHSSHAYPACNSHKNKMKMTQFSPRTLLVTAVSLN